MKIPKTTKLALLLLCLGCFTACKNKSEKAAELLTKEFFKALKQDDTTSLYRLYPSYRNFEIHYKSDTAEITDTKTKNDLIEVTVKNGFTNIKKTYFERNITLIIKNENGKLSIADSRGLSDIKSTEIWPTIVQKKLTDTSIVKTDQEWQKISQKAYELVIEDIKKVMEKLKVEVPVSNVSWDKEYGFVDGKAKVSNNTKFPIYNLKYQVAYMDANHKILELKDGYVSYDTIQPGQIREITFTHPEIKEAKFMDVGVVFDKYFLLNLVKK